MSDQLKYGDRVTKPQSAQMPREEDRYFEFEHVLGPASAIKEAYFKLTFEGTDVLVLSLEEEPDQWYFGEENRGRIWIKHANTSGLDFSSSYRCGVELIDQIDLHYTPVLGTFQLQDDVINDNATAPYLTWSTRQDLQDAIDALSDSLEGIKTCNNLTSLTADALATATAITVANGGTCPAGSIIRIMLNDETYDERTVATQVVNALTFSGGLSEDSDTGKMVRRVS